MISGNYQYKVSFKGYEDNIKLGEDAVKKIRRMNLHSSTAVDLRRQQRTSAPDKGGRKTPPEIFRYLHKIRGDYAITASRVCGDIMNAYTKLSFPKDYKEFSKAVKDVVSMYKVANCGEQAFLAQADLLEAGKKADTIHFIIKRKSDGEEYQNRQHTFLVLGLAKDASIQDPKTWGQDAVIVDPWSGLVKRAYHGVEVFKEMFGFDKNQEEIVFHKEKNLFEESPVQKNKTQ